MTAFFRFLTHFLQLVKSARWHAWDCRMHAGIADITIVQELPRSPTDRELLYVRTVLRATVVAALTAVPAKDEVLQ